MLSHYWLNGAANYEYKYTDKQYEVMILKKQIQGNDKGKANLDDSV
jgi:hypothetical protein